MVQIFAAKCQLPTGVGFFLYRVSFGYKIRAIIVLGIWVILVFMSSFKYTSMQLLKWCPEPHKNLFSFFFP